MNHSHRIPVDQQPETWQHPTEKRVEAEVGAAWGGANADQFIRAGSALHTHPQSLPPPLNFPTTENSTLGTGWCMDMDRNAKQCCVRSLRSEVRQMWVAVLALHPTWEPQFLIYEMGTIILPYEGIQEANKISSINCLA